jgi:hypothetical protein
MRKSILFALIWAVLFGLIHTGCDKDSGTNFRDKLIGTWNLVKILANQEGIQVEIDIGFVGLSEVTLEVREDGTYTLTQKYETGETEVTNGTWTATKSTITINPDNDDPETMNYKLDGNTATLGETTFEFDDQTYSVKLVYTKQS